MLDQPAAANPAWQGNAPDPGTSTAPWRVYNIGNNQPVELMDYIVFEGRQAAAWLATGLKVITRELPEQVLADGGNFERSPMYHAIFLEDVLDLVNAAAQWPGLVSEAQVPKN